MSGILNLKN